MRFFIGTSPKDAYMLPSGTHMMLNARQFWKNGRWKVSKPSNAGDIFLDCGGYLFFRDLPDYPFSPGAYMSLVSQLRPQYFASMDYPCEPKFTGNLGATIRERIERTVDNAAELKNMLPLIGYKSQLVPVIQGWVLEDYLYCLELHQKSGTLMPYMAVGSLCVRARLKEIIPLVQGISEAAISMGVERLHAFGLKVTPNLQPIERLLYSRDSAAVYYISSARKKDKQAWSTIRGGRPTWKAPNREAKRQAIRDFTDSLTQQGYRWATNLDRLADELCLVGEDTLDAGLLAYAEYEQVFGHEFE